MPCIMMLNAAQYVKAKPPHVGTSISHVKQVTILHDNNCDRKFEFRYCIVTDRKTAHASEIVLWITFGFLLEGTHLTKFFFGCQI